LSKASINVDLIIQATHDKNINDITFTVTESELTKTIEQCKLIIKQNNLFDDLYVKEKND